jgi:hypothetical protein
MRGSGGGSLCRASMRAIAACAAARSPGVPGRSASARSAVNLRSVEASIMAPPVGSSRRRRSKSRCAVRASASGRTGRRHVAGHRGRAPRRAGRRSTDQSSHGKQRSTRRGSATGSAARRHRRGQNSMGPMVKIELRWGAVMSYRRVVHRHVCFFGSASPSHGEAFVTLRPPYPGSAQRRTCGCDQVTGASALSPRRGRRSA